MHAFRNTNFIIAIKDQFDAFFYDFYEEGFLRGPPSYVKFLSYNFS